MTVRVRVAVPAAPVSTARAVPATGTVPAGALPTARAVPAPLVMSVSARAVKAG